MHESVPPKTAGGGALRVVAAPGALRTGAIAPPKKHPSPRLDILIRQYLVTGFWRLVSNMRTKIFVGRVRGSENVKSI